MGPVQVRARQLQLVILGMIMSKIEIVNNAKSFQIVLQLKKCKNGMSFYKNDHFSSNYGPNNDAKMALHTFSSINDQSPSSIQ